MKNKQQGAALIIVLALLSGSLMIGISGMNSALIDERLAGNYRAAALAQMNAERAASEASTDESFDNPTYWASNANADDSELASSSWKEMIKEKSYKKLKEDYPLEIVDEAICDSGEDSYSRCLYFPVVINGSEYYVVAMGAVEDEEGNSIAESEPFFLKFDYNEIKNSPAIDEFIDNILGLGDGITTFNKEVFSSSNNDKAENWKELIVNVNSSDFFAEDDDFLSFVEELRQSPKVNYFSSLSSNELSNYNNSIVVVEEDFSWNGSNSFEGILILLGKGESGNENSKNKSGFSYNGGGNGSFKGSVVHIPYETDEEGLKFLSPKIDVSGGNGNFEFDETVIDGLKGDGGGGSGGDFGIQRWEWE
ncbi:hypothetical protein VRRI112168_10925 [Vreelandella rituensis]|uniref:Type 4 fimbrial biogenesis protein PilX N-terminal domain-containing protein n=1 Tax=Vreelandella rituensis TaxID=2282306 RepID=A0A368U5L1_9GAMM|nr:hypothetical protein [Halomonas rituensis]RCV90323.1 hypothetical protein DU506_11970 [Halomonas rituensis]